MASSSAASAASLLRKGVAKVGVVWFKGNDLRIKDNAVMIASHRECTSVNHIFCLDPRNFRTTKLGYEKTSLKRLAFLVDSLLDLKQSLKLFGSDLDVFVGRCEDVIETYCKVLQTNSSNSTSNSTSSSTSYSSKSGGGVGGGSASKRRNFLYTFDEYIWEEKTILKEVSSRLQNMKGGAGAGAGGEPFEVISTEFWGGGTLMAPNDLNFDVKTGLGFFTAFRKKVEGDDLVTPENLPMAPNWPELGIGAKPRSDVPAAVWHASSLELAQLDNVVALWTRLRDLGTREIEAYGDKKYIGGCCATMAAADAPKAPVLDASLDSDILPDSRSAVPFTNLLVSSSKASSSSGSSGGGSSGGSSGGDGGIEGLLGGGENAAIRRVNHYITKGTGRLSLYKQTRNGMIGADYSSKLSVYLALGNISARYVLKEIKDFEKKSGIADENTYWLIFELLWRDYMHFYMLRYGRKLFYLGGIRDDKAKHPWRTDPPLLEMWRRGMTGYPLIDANMRELKATGFMSNRGRQIVASFLVRDLKQDWRHGAEWFESQLLDHDVCSNWGNWQYSAGIGADPREDRYFNVVKQGNDYDPQAQYIRLWCPEIAMLPNRVLLDPRLITDAMRTQYNVSDAVYPRIAVRLAMESFPQASAKFVGTKAAGSNSNSHSSNGNNNRNSNSNNSSNTNNNSNRNSTNNNSNTNTSSKSVNSSIGGGGVGGGRVDVILALSNPNYTSNASNNNSSSVFASVPLSSDAGSGGHANSNSSGGGDGKRSKKQEKKHEHGFVPGRK